MGKLSSSVIRLSKNDNVVVSRHTIEKDKFIEAENITVKTEIPSGYKIAIQNIKKGDPVIKYNTPIGYATEDIEPGTMIHSHNILFDQVDKDYAFARDYSPVKLIAPEKRKTFKGIIRENGKVGTRNYIGVFAVGNCSATVTRRIADYFTKEKLAQYPNVDGVIPFIHELGCGMEMTGPGMDLLRRTIAGYIRNPNISAAVVVALGCERNDAQVFFDSQNLQENSRLKLLNMEKIGGTRKTVNCGIEEIEKMLPVVNMVKREEVSAEHLIVALQCGGSDGFSGVSANPALGAAMDILVQNGGTAILSETTEIFGAEQTLTRRAVSREVGRKLVDKLEWWLKYTKGKDVQINGRVSPGNNLGGISNVLEKSLGGVKKGGDTPLMEVLDYAQPVTVHGLVFMDTPAYDPVSATGQVAGGANLIAFTTGRGSCYGGLPAPTIKLASNTPMYLLMEEDMDVNCGAIVDGEKTIEEMGQEIFLQLLRIASGEKTKSEELGVGENEFVPWPYSIVQ